MLGGMELEHEKGPVGHSDGDTLLHAVTDAILGALGEPDIGRLFPDTAPENEGADSRRFLEEAVLRMKRHGMRIGNMDTTIICEKPKISPHADRMAENLAGMLGCDPSQINHTVIIRDARRYSVPTRIVTRQRSTDTHWGTAHC